MKNLNELHEELKLSNPTFCAFHTGRGGRFWNAGHVSFIGFQRIDHYTDDLFLNFENQSDFNNRYGFDSTGDDSQKCILDLITDENLEELEEKFGITEEMLGEKIYMKGNGNTVGLTEKEADSGVGSINIDYAYDTTTVCYLTDCSDGELQLIKDSDYFDSLSSAEQEYVNLSLGIEEEETAA